MQTIAQYKKHYPNLSASETKLLHCARIAFEYHNWSLSRVRTIALRPLIYLIAPSAVQLDVANQLLISPQTSEYPNNVLNYPRVNADARILIEPMAPAAPMEDVVFTASDWAVCKAVGYHSDDIDSDQYAYAFWCIKSSSPMALMLGSNAYPMLDGQLVIFDARIPHALVSESSDATMVGIISTVALTPNVCSELGIVQRRVRNTSLSALAVMDNLDLNAFTGNFSLPGM